MANHFEPRTKLLEWIMQQTEHLSEDVSLGERVYVVLHGERDRTCEYGSTKIFNTLNKGYRFCAHDCRCRREERSRKITAHEQSLSDEERQRRLKAMQDTMQERYGVTNAMHVPEHKRTFEENNVEKWGTAYPGGLPEVRQKAIETNLDRYGVEYPTVLDSVKEKARLSNFEKYGSESNMHIARAAFAEQTGIDNPFKMPEYQEKAKQTMLERYGVEKALENPDILNKMISDTEAKYGVKSVLMLPENIGSPTEPSKIGTAWLDSLGVPVREHVIYFEDSYCRVDGFDPDTNTVYLFHGDFWHGNPAVFEASEINTKTSTTHGYLYEKTMKIEQKLQDAGYDLVVMWEKDWKSEYKKQRK